MKSVEITEKGQHTLHEIVSQPRCWNACLTNLAVSDELRAATRLARSGAEWIFVGCGTSYYLAQAAAASFNYLGLPAYAVPASELLMYPALTLHAGRDYIPVVISRSGRTSEAVRVAQMLEKEHNLRALAITCADGQPLEAACSLTLKLLDADEQSTVMTRSFTSMLLGLQYLAAIVSGNDRFRRALLDLSKQVAPLLEDIPRSLRVFVESRSFSDFVFLAQGPLFGIASECMLKVTESSSSYAQVFHSLEFRHGPKSIAGPDTLITFLMSETSYDAEVELLEEMKALGAATMAIANCIDSRAQRAADFTIELGLQSSEYVRLAAFVIWGQLYGVYYGIKKGLNPDSPKNLTRVVELGPTVST
ncbi:MAG TPA: SIS domain-containing protein [Terriglobales bacterium]|jgi:glucosamine--fructose-6-phosphate aminotransferase (isomerizing)|nr:SIS domain-containing protein [Terriglobales bacterium]